MVRCFDRGGDKTPNLSLKYKNMKKISQFFENNFILLYLLTFWAIFITLLFVL